MLLSMTNVTSADSESHSESCEVIINCEIDRVRYLLIKCPVTHLAASLTPRQIQIVRMVAQGLQTKVIAQTLKTSSWTVSTTCGESLRSSV